MHFIYTGTSSFNSCFFSAPCKDTCCKELHSHSAQLKAFVEKTLKCQCCFGQRHMMPSSPFFFFFFNMSLKGTSYIRKTSCLLIDYNSGWSGCHNHTHTHKKRCSNYHAMQLVQPWSPLGKFLLMSLEMVTVWCAFGLNKVDVMANFMLLSLFFISQQRQEAF